MWKRVKKSVEALQLLSNLTQESLDKFIIRDIYNDKRSNTLGETRARKWKSMKTKKAKSIARLGPDRNSNYYRNQRVIYHVNVLLNFQNSSAPPSPLNENGYFIQNGLCLPILNSQPALPNELTRRINQDDGTDSDTEEEDSDEHSCDEDSNEDVDDQIDI